MSLQLARLVSMPRVRAAVGAAALGAATASPILANPYASGGVFPNAGAYNTTSYTFTATGNGLNAYFLGKAGAAFDDFLEVFDNGVLLTAANGATQVLENHATGLGTGVSYASGIKAGDTLTFAVMNASLGATVYSNAALNGAYDRLAGASTGKNHIYSTAYSGSATAGAAFPTSTGVPAGTYVGFEDLPIGPGGVSYNGGTYPTDYSYDDEAFVFTSTNTVATVPEPGMLPILGLSVAVLGVLFVRRRRKGKPKL